MPARAAIIAAILGPLLVVLSTLEPGILTGDALIGAGTADTWGHAWGYWWAAEAVGNGSFPLTGAPIAHPDGASWWLIDYPVALPLIPVTALLGPAAAYHLALMGHVALGAGGLAWWLSRKDAPLAVAVVAGVLFALSPFVRGALASGVPEALSVGAVPWLAGTLEDGLKGRWGSLAAAGGISAWLAMDGVYGAVPGAMVGGTVLGAALWRDRSVRTALLGLIPLAAAAIPLAATWLALRTVGHPAMKTVAPAVKEPFEPTRWVTAPLGGADVLNFIAPAHLLPTPELHVLHHHTVYLGMAVVGAAVASARDRRTWPLLALAAAAVVLALGQGLSIGGSTWLPMPGALLAALGVRNLYRVAGLAVLALLAAGALGWRRWSLDNRVVAGITVALALAEGLFLAPVPAILPTVPDPNGPAEAWLADQEGAIVDLPFDRAGHYPWGPFPQRTFYRQTAHERPIASALYREPPARRANPTLVAIDAFLVRAWADDVSWARPRPPGTSDGVDRGAPKAEWPTRAQRATDRLKLTKQGFRWLVVDWTAVPPGSRPVLRDGLDAWLGPPVHDGDRSVYALDAQGRQ